MNGRIYDPTLGRFLQADPFIQAPKNSQSYNRYSYVLNNPLSYTDPSGYFFKKLLRSIAKIPILNAAINVVFAIYCQVCLVAYNAASTYAVTGSLKAAFTSGLVSAIAPGGASLGNIATTALIGGLAAKAQGGKFGHGFWSAGLGAALGGRIKLGNPVANVVAAAVVGGTISKLTGGKFANGAQTWAFSAAIAQDWGSSDNAQVADNAEPKGISNKVTKNEAFDLEVDGNKLRGSLSVVCNGGKAACNQVISEFNKINGQYGNNTIDIAFELNDSFFGGDIVVNFEKIYVNWNGKILQANGIYDGEFFSLFRGDYAQIRLNPTSGGYRQGSTAFHEFGHAIGLAHQSNVTRSIMSYSKWRGGLTNIEAQRLVDAYR